MMIGKKGAVLHWAVAGILLVMAGFALISFNSEDLSGLKADLAYNYLSDYTYFTEKSLDLRESIIRQEAKELIVELASIGGDYTSDCGDYERFNLWNDDSQLCFPLAEEVFLEEVKSASVERFSDGKISSSTYEYTHDDKYLLVKSNTPFRTELGEKSYYEIPNNFAIDLDYSFDEYALLGQQAQVLLGDCSNDLALKDCLDTKMIDGWHYADCINPTYIEDKRQVAFCVESPSSAKVYDTTLGIFIEVDYKFALDFSSSITFPIESVVDFDPSFEMHAISFPNRDNAQQYAIYLTSYEDLDYFGSSGDFIGATFEGIYYESIDIALEEIDPSCSLTSGLGAIEYTAYNCGDEIIYYVDTNLINEEGPFYAGVTVFEDNVESNINGFIELI